MTPVQFFKWAWPHVLRCVALSLAAFALSWGLTSNAGLVSAMLGACAGVIGGQRLASTRFRLPVVVGWLFVCLLLVWGLARAAVAWTFVPNMLGAALTLALVEIVRFAVLPATVCAGLRVSASRRPTLVGLELVFVAVAVTSVFAAHRDGVISRPLWLADWAFRSGIDPARVILGVGFASTMLLATQLLVETKSGRAASSLVVLVALAAIGMLCVQAVGTPKPQAEAEAGRTDEQGEEPPPPPPGEEGGTGNQDKSDGGGRPDQGNDGGHGPDKNQADGGGHSNADGGGMDAGPMPPPSQRLTDDPANGSSPAPVAVVIFADDYSPPSQTYFFRQESLSQWNGTRFVATGRGDADRDYLLTFPTEKTSVQEPPAETGRTLVHHTVALLIDHANPFGLEGAVNFAPAKNPNPTRFVRAFKVESRAQTIEYKKLVGKKAGDPKWSDELRAYYTVGPTDPRYGTLAQKYVQKLPEKLRDDPFAKALAVKTGLDKDLTYSKKVHYAGKDPTAEMLFGTKIGYCVHFAHSAAILWRSLGIPARVSTGYRADEDNRKGGSALVLKGGDAHMWPELYLEGVGWIVLDVTAERNLDPPSQGQDEDLQRLLGNMAREEGPEPDQPKPPPPRHYGRDIGIAGGSLVLLIGALLYAIKIWRRIAPSAASGRRLARVGYRAALDMLSEVGFVRTHGETREAFATRIAESAPSFREITDLHVAASFRDPSTPASERKELGSAAWKPALSQLRKDLSTHVKTGKRLVGFLNPASFLASR